MLLKVSLMRARWILSKAHYFGVGGWVGLLFAGVFAHTDKPMKACKNLVVMAAMSLLFTFNSQAQFTILHTFLDTDGGYPAGLVQGSDGTFYGTTYYGGTHDIAHGGDGTVFKVTPTGTFTSLYSFTGGSDGGYPGGLVQGTDGDFYGTTYYGGLRSGLNGNGTIFKITPTGSLTTICSGAGHPNGLVQGADDNLYGTTGANGSGTIFNLTPTGVLTTLWSSFGDYGSLPNALIRGSDGYLYGTSSGSTYLPTTDFGTVFRLTIPVPPTITTASQLPSGIVDTPYNLTLATTGGTTPYSWSVVSGNLPEGLSLSNSTGVIGGLPTSATNASFTVQVTGADSMYSTQSFTLTIAPATRIIGVSGNLTFWQVIVGMTPTAILTITNSGNSTLNVSGISYPTGFSGAWSGSIASGGSHNVTVTFAPVAVASYGGTVTVTSDATSGTSTIAASGTGAQPMTVSKLQATVNFAKPNKDSCSLTATLNLGASFQPNGQTLTLVIGDGQITYSLNKTGVGVYDKNTCRITHARGASQWKLAATWKNGSWQTSWVSYGLINDTIKKPGNAVTLPVQVDVAGEEFAGNSPTLHYTAKWGKSGTAK